ncbi:MAG: alpha/beta fold hydrolase [Proteobacteria bacterium]|jgi:predicted esterase YcpF (UPF0227 family)|nr:alpha/beta fold hydrolase [Pseudomonadota bacterium]
MSLLSDYDYIYLHGFASHPESGKAQFFMQKFSELGILLYIPDLNNNDFSKLTLTRQLNQVEEIIQKCTKPIILIGSSMGGLISTILAEHNLNIKKIILLAPAFQMSQLWRIRITKEQLDNWKDSGYADIFHYGYKKDTPLHHEFYLDLFKHEDADFKRQLSALIFHGIHDDVVPIALSQEYIKSNPNAQLISTDDDHSLGKDLEKAWNKTISFIQQNS